MTDHEIGSILKNMYDKAPCGYQVANIHLLGEKGASIILKNKLRVNEIISVSISELNQSYKSEFRIDCI